MNMTNLNLDSKTAIDEVTLKSALLNIRRYIKYLKSKWILISTVIVLGSMIGYMYARSKKVTYSASTTFVLEDGNGSSGLGNLGGLASIVGVDVRSSSGLFQGDNILELYRSRKMIEATLLTTIVLNGKKTTLLNEYIKINNLREHWINDDNKLSNIDFINSQSLPKPNRLIDSLLGLVSADINKNYLSVSKPDKKLSIVKVQVNATDEVFAKVFNDKIVENVNDFYIRTKTKKAIENTVILQQKTDSVRRVMNGDIYSSVAVADATPNLNPTRQVQRAVPAQKSQFSAETNKTILGELVKNLEMSKMALLKEAPLIQVIDQPVFPLDRQKFGSIKGLALGGITFGLICIMVLSLRKIFIELTK